MFVLKDRLRAAGIHFTLSLAVAALAALLVFVLWYPYPYREISGGRELFFIVVAVDVVLGPLITFAVFDRAKPVRELVRDMAVVVTIQLAGLAYGLWTVAVARPVHLVFEYDRLRVVHAIDVPEELLARRAPGVDAMPWTGPTLLAARPFTSEAEKVEFTMAAMAGLHLGMRPELWSPYASARERVRAAARPLSELRRRFPARAAEIDAALARAGLPPERVVWLPVAGRKDYWTALLDRDAPEPVAYLPLDPY